MSDLLQDIREKIALSCRILAMEGLVDGILGHVSVRIPGTDEMFIRCRGEEENGVRYTRSDAIRRVDFDGNGADLEGKYDVPKELPIHGEMYKLRPEVGCVIHAHPLDALICGITDLEFRPVFGAFNIPAMRMALEGIPVFPCSCLITRQELAHYMMQAMGDKNICLMKGHGITVTGKTVEEATVRALNFNILAKVTLQVAQTGREAAPISQEDMNELPDLGTTFNDQWGWRYYVKKLHEEEKR
ncbi:class II aldolase/adducin family protein [Paenibacillus sp. EPM92]|uniref:class II aldolase/adducin family protein n=1 Tax=Paenibacillus sp. EPM92 TaxID=1561195 RepID=UPI0019157919|nr:class II aldolase/adducin family protein [Paenibacillus sp. EPM92]